MTLPQVKLGELSVSRLIVGGNPFSGNSHQSRQLDAAMRDWFTTARIIETLHACEEQGLTTFLGRADAHVMRVLHEYWNDGGKLQWIAQTAPEMWSVEDNIRRAVGAGAAAVYLHGGWFDDRWARGEIAPAERALALIRQLGRPAGIAAHVPRFHLEAAERLDLDFHLVCVFQCGSILTGRGDTFDLADVPVALDAIQRLSRPCIAFKVLGAGRFDPAVMLPQVCRGIKPTDAVLLGFYPQHHPTQVADTVALVRALLPATTAASR